MALPCAWREEPRLRSMRDLNTHALAVPKRATPRNNSERMRTLSGKAILATKLPIEFSQFVQSPCVCGVGNLEACPSDHFQDFLPFLGLGYVQQGLSEGRFEIGRQGCLNHEIGRASCRERVQI